MSFKRSETLSWFFGQVGSRRAQLHHSAISGPSSLAGRCTLVHCINSGPISHIEKLGRWCNSTKLVGSQVFTDTGITLNSKNASYYIQYSVCATISYMSYAKWRWRVNLNQRLAIKYKSYATTTCMNNLYLRILVRSSPSAHFQTMGREDCETTSVSGNYLDITKIRSSVAHAHFSVYMLH